MRHAFGDTRPFTVGVEEELLLVDGATHRLAHVAEEVLAAIELPRDAADYEAFAAQIELRSPPCDGPETAVRRLREGRAAARRAGATLMGTGLHPGAARGDVRLMAKKRYRKVAEGMRGLFRRTPESALHVHVGMPDPEAAIRAFNGLRRHLPLLQGLAANSPFWFAEDSGLASARAAMVRAYPGRGIPPPFRDFAHYEELLAATAAAGGPEDYTLLWWDVRPHPRLGTVEVRELDAQSRLGDVQALAALIQALAREAAERPYSRDGPSDALAWAAFRAVRDGLDAQVPHEGELLPLREAARRTVRRLGADDLDGVERILREGGGADRQRAAHAEGGVGAVLERLVEETRAG
jgi:carboxylate-amine ligase